MSKEPLWTDAKIKALTVLAANTVDPQARWMHEQIAKDMRNDYERALASRNEQISRLQGELRNMQARITELEGELKQMLTATLTSAQEYEKILLGKNERIAELEANTAGQEKLLQMYVGLAHSWTVLAHGQADQITKLDAEIDRLRQQELGIVDSGDDEDDE